ncbi:MAG: hypothetical protein WBA63_15785 [Thermomicrobiales bacterium]
MSSLLTDLIIGFWVLLFGAMALFPLMLDSKSTHHSSTAHSEDRVISIRPIATRESQLPHPITQPGHAILAQDQDLHDQEHPRRAA